MVSGACISSRSCCRNGNSTYQQQCLRTKTDHQTQAHYHHHPPPANDPGRHVVVEQPLHRPQGRGVLSCRLHFRGLFVLANLSNGAAGVFVVLVDLVDLVVLVVLVVHWIIPATSTAATAAAATDAPFRATLPRVHQRD